LRLSDCAHNGMKILILIRMHLLVRLSVGNILLLWRVAVTYIDRMRVVRVCVADDCAVLIRDISAVMGIMLVHWPQVGMR
jgi:hypothetical protein